MDLSGALKSKERRTMREKRGRRKMSVRGRERTIKVCLRLSRQVCWHAKKNLTDSVLVHSCALASEQDVIRGRARGQ